MIKLPLEALRAAAHAEPLGIYLHVPFCVDRCTYCSFTSTCDQSLRPRVVAKLAQELWDWGETLEGPAFDTLYLGGGTPSVLTLEELTQLTASAMGLFGMSRCREATLEANPGTADRTWMAGARRLGWDRISLGIQTLDDDLLRRLGRIHDSKEGLAALARAREVGFDRISGDLMLGIPGQSLERVRTDAHRLVEAGATHLSIYMLDLDKACPLKILVDSGTVTLPPEEEVADAYELLLDELPSLGLAAYEISNFAMPGQESLHNMRYWERRPYLGLGPSAASHLGTWRWTEEPDIRAWTEDQQEPDIQALTPAEELAEIPLLGLRMQRGVDWSRLRTRADELGLRALVEAWETELEPFHRHGLLEWEGLVRRLTRQGLLLSNRVLEVFV